MNYIVWFTEPAALEVAEVGRKGASLGRLTQAQLPVPLGFVVSVRAFEDFFSLHGLADHVAGIIERVDAREMAQVKSAGQQLERLMLAAEMPDAVVDEIATALTQLGVGAVAVRSSVTVEDAAGIAWAGQLASYLNVRQAEVVAAVRRCWASLFSPSALWYRFEQNKNMQSIEVAAIVQQMVPAQVAGVVSSIHPVTQNERQLYIEAAPGLGESVVSGLVTPDVYVVDKYRRRVESQELVGEVAVLSKEQIGRIAQLAIEIEHYFGFPVDIEWALAAGKINVLQSRRIAGLSIASLQG